MRILTLLLAALALTACNNQAETSTAAGRDFQVDRLFTHEGCTVYRFRDGGNSRYYTNCQGQTTWQESCGKNCTQAQGVN